ncbi:MAG: hypothetical protein HC819_23305 [Cyclobacteriaceae bacterium]|nr:hypothetical protein [Cyclobacteriaceae bacterium]
MLFLCTLIFFLIGYFISKNLPKEYRVVASIKVESSNKSVAQNLFENLSLIEENISTSNETAILKSYDLVRSSLKAIDYKVTYFKNERLFDKVQYQNCPFIIVVDTSANQLINKKISIEILDEYAAIVEMEVEANDDYYYNYRAESQYQIKESIQIKDTVYFDSVFASKYLSFKLIKKPLFTVSDEVNYAFVIEDLNYLTENYITRLKINPIVKDADILELKLNSKQPERDILFLNALISIYTQQNYNVKNQIAINIIEFIDNQLIELSDSLQFSEMALQNIRSDKQLVNIGYESKLLFDELQSLENQRADELIKYKYYDHLNEYVVQENVKDIIAPSLMGIQDPTLNDLITTLTDYLALKTLISTSAGEKNPKLSNLNQNIANVKTAILENLKNIKTNSKLKIEDIQERLDQVQKLVNKLPESERILLNAQRKYEFNDNIYNYFLQKRAEASILKESNIPVDLIIDEPRMEGDQPVSPNTKLIILLFTGVGLFLPLIIVFARDLVSNKIISRSHLIELIGSEKLLLEDIPKSKISKRKVHQLDRRCKEALRALSFKIINGESIKSIAISSLSQNEGKPLLPITWAKH